MSDSIEHGADMWPPNFQDLPLESQVQLATHLSRQNEFLRGMPFLHSAADLNNISSRLDKDDFGWALSFDPEFIAKLCKFGFLPMAGQCFADLICLLPKLHRERCAIVNLSEDLKVPRSTKKRSRHYEVTIDEDFDEVIKAIQLQHGARCWFYAPLTKAYRSIHAHNNDIAKYGVRIHSIELWKPQTLAGDGSELSPRRLVAGELGYSVGKCYTSLSGFRLKDASGAGTVQCCAVAKLLFRCGFTMWDLGMGMQYKYDLGARDLPRDDYLRLLGECRDGVNSELCVLHTDEPIRADILLKEERLGMTEDLIT